MGKRELLAAGVACGKKHHWPSLRSLSHTAKRSRLAMSALGGGGGGG